MPLTTIYTSSQVGTNTDTTISYRQRCVLTGGGQRAQVSFTCVAGGSWIADHASVGILTGTNWDTTATPVELTFSSGGHGFNVAATGQTIVSDEIDLGTPFTSSNKLVVIIDWNASNGASWLFGTAANCDAGYFTTASGGYNIASAGAPGLGSNLSKADAGLVLIQAEPAAGAPIAKPIRRVIPVRRIG